MANNKPSRVVKIMTKNRILPLIAALMTANCLHAGNTPSLPVETKSASSSQNSRTDYHQLMLEAAMTQRWDLVKNYIEQHNLDVHKPGTVGGVFCATDIFGNTEYTRKYKFDNYTVLMFAQYYQHAEMIDYLVQKGVHPH